MNPLYLVDGYKPGHKALLPPDVRAVYGHFTPRSVKHAHPSITKITHFGSILAWKYLINLFDKEFFYTKERKSIEAMPNELIRQANIRRLKTKALEFTSDLNKYLGTEYDKTHLNNLWDLGYLPLDVWALPEGTETLPNIPHQAFINSDSRYAWLTLFLETTVSMLSWEASTTATIIRKFRENVDKWVDKTDVDCTFRGNLCHDFSARGTNPFTNTASSLAFALFFSGSDTLAAIPASREYYEIAEDDVIINSVVASEHSVTCISIFNIENFLIHSSNASSSINEYYSFDIPAEGSVENPDIRTIAEYLTFKQWINRHPYGFLSLVIDTFDTWKNVTQIIPRLKEQILARDGKIVLRPDSGNPVDMICGIFPEELEGEELHEMENNPQPYHKGLIELLWDIFGGEVNSQGYKVLNPKIGAIYGDSITLERQEAIYRKLEAKGFAVSNVVLGVGSYTIRYNTRDTLGFAAKAAAFEKDSSVFPIFKDPITDDGTKKSLKGYQLVTLDEETGEYKTEEVEKDIAFSDLNLLKLIVKEGKVISNPSFHEIRERIFSN